MYVKTYSLHGDLEEEIYMRQLDDSVVKGREQLVCRLKRSLYGLKLSPRMWYQKFDTFEFNFSYKISEEYHCIYIKVIVDQILIIVLYVDDIHYLWVTTR